MTSAEEVPVVRSFALAAVSSVLVVSLAACGGAAAPTLAPGATPPPGGVPTQAPVGNPAEACAGQPTYSPDNPLPSFGQDTTLNSRFPTQVDGQPVTNQTSAFWLQSMCFYGSTAEEVANFIAIWPPGTAPLISNGSARVELDGETVYFSALRIPGGDPNQIFSHIPEFIAALGGDAEDAANTTVTTASVGGKNVYVVTGPDGDATYNYVSGDTLWTVDADEATAAKVFAAIQ